MAKRAWSDVLNELEQSARDAMRLLSESDQLAHERSPLTQWTPPDDIGELPDDLRPRALEVLAEIDAVEKGLANRRDDVMREIVKQRSQRLPHEAGRRFDRDV